MLITSFAARSRSALLARRKSFERISSSVSIQEPIAMPGTLAGRGRGRTARRRTFLEGGERDAPGCWQPGRARAEMQPSLRWVRLSTPEGASHVPAIRDLVGAPESAGHSSEGHRGALPRRALEGCSRTKTGEVRDDGHPQAVVVARWKRRGSRLLLR